MLPSKTTDQRDAFAAGLDSFHNPASVAVVGASANPAKWGHWLAIGAATGAHRRPVYLVNTQGSEIAGITSLTSLAQLPEVPELLAIAVPGAHVLGVIREGLEMGVRAFLVVAAHMDGEAEAAALLKQYGARMIGPNSLGIYSAGGELQLMWGSMQPGSLSIVSQSGQLGSEIAAIGLRAGVGVSRFVSLGNQTDVHAAEIVRSMIGDGQTKTIGLYLEDFTGATELFAAVAAASTAGIRVLLLTTGESDAAQDLAQSHTGAMTSAMDLVDAACRASGAVRVRTPSELVEAASYLDRQPVPAGPRIAVISDSGGQGGIAADAAARLGLEVPSLSPELRERMRPLLSAQASTRNPIDLAGSGEANMSTYAELAHLIAESGEVDAVVLSGYFCSYGFDTPALFDAERVVAERLAEATSVPVLVHAMAPQSEISQLLRDLGVPVTGRIEDALGALSVSLRSAVGPRPAAAPGASIAAGTQSEVREALAVIGVAVPQTRVVRSAAEAAAAARELGGTVVLKAAWLAHKTEAGGVRLGLKGEDQAGMAFAEMHGRIGDGPYTLEQQDTREHVAEFIVAARQDATFGTVISVGFGGTETEIWSDLVSEIAPVDEATADAMIGALRSSRLLDPWRGRPALDRAALASVVSRVSRAVAASPAIRELELNPVRVGVEGALVVDCLAVLDTVGETTPAPALDTAHHITLPDFAGATTR